MQTAPPIRFTSTEAVAAGTGIAEVMLGLMTRGWADQDTNLQGESTFFNLGVTLITGQENPMRLEAHLNYKENNPQ